MGERLGRAPGGRLDRGLREPDRRPLAGRSRTAGDRPGSARAAADGRRLHDLHTGLQCRRSAQHRRLARRSRPLLGGRGRDASGRDRGDDDKPARARECRGRPDLEPRARVDGKPDRERVASRARSRPRHPDRRGPGAASPEAGGVRAGHLLPAEGAHRARAEAQTPWSHRPRLRPGRKGRQSTRACCSEHRAGSRRRRSSTSRTLSGSGEAAHRHAPALEGRDLDEGPERNLRSACARLHG